MFFKYSKVTSDICGLIKNVCHAQYPKDLFRAKIPVSFSSQVIVFPWSIFANWSLEDELIFKLA